MKKLENNDGSFEEPNPYLFPSAFNKEEEKFIEVLIRSKITNNGHDGKKSQH